MEEVTFLPTKQPPFNISYLTFPSIFILPILFLVPHQYCRDTIKDFQTVFVRREIFGVKDGIRLSEPKVRKEEGIL